MRELSLYTVVELSRLGSHNYTFSHVEKHGVSISNQQGNTAMTTKEYTIIYNKRTHILISQKSHNLRI